MKKREKCGGLSASPEYTVWFNMISRCRRENHPNFERYGGRGITVHPEWAVSFNAFIQAVGKRPTAKHWIERIDNDKGYVPGNVKWATRKEQMRNTRHNHWIEIDGRKQLLCDWAKERDIDQTTILHRIARGMSERDAVMVPARFGGRRASKRKKAA